MTTHDGTAGSYHRFALVAIKWLPNLIGLLAATGVILLILTGHTEQIATVASLAIAAIAAIAGGVAVRITVNIRR